MYSTFTFGLLFTISRRKTVDFSSIWSDPYGLNFGDFVDPDDNVEFTMDYIVFIGATLFNVVLLLNLLISILGDSYQKFQLKQVIIDYRERAEFVLDIQIMKNLTKFSMDQNIFIFASLPIKKKTKVKIGKEESSIWIENLIELFMNNKKVIIKPLRTRFR